MPPFCLLGVQLSILHWPLFGPVGQGRPPTAFRRRRVRTTDRPPVHLAVEHVIDILRQLAHRGATCGGTGHGGFENAKNVWRGGLVLLGKAPGRCFSGFGARCGGGGLPGAFCGQPGCVWSGRAWHRAAGI